MVLIVAIYRHTRTHLTYQNPERKKSRFDAFTFIIRNTVQAYSATTGVVIEPGTILHLEQFFAGSAKKVGWWLPPTPIQINAGLRVFMEVPANFGWRTI